MQGRMTIFRPGVAVSEQRKLDAPPELEELHKLVGGYIEKVPLWFRYEGKPCAALCDEEGKLKGYPINMPATLEWKRALVRSIPAEEISGQLRADVLVGTVVVLTGDDEFMDAL